MGKTEVRTGWVTLNCTEKMGKRIVSAILQPLVAGFPRRVDSMQPSVEGQYGCKPSDTDGGKSTMILADKITELRKKNGWSQEELADKLGVSRQSISKWESTQSIPDMNRILKMSEVFGVSTDLLLKDDMEIMDDRESIDTVETYGKALAVSMEEAGEFLSFRSRSSGRIATGVLLCILSPVLLIVLSGLQAGGIISISEMTACAISLIVMLLMVGIAVAIFVIYSLQGQRYEYLEKEMIDTEYGVDGMVKDRREKYRQPYSIQLVIGIVMCVMSAIPLFLAMLVFGESEAASSISVGAILVLVAVGVFLIVRCSIVWGSFQILLQEGDYTPESKAEAPKYARIATIYWCSATALFLALSFLTKAWDRTWIIWPVAGVAYGIVAAITSSLRKKA